MNGWPRLLTALLVPFAFFACANYRLGTGSELSFRSLYIEPVRVEAQIPQAQAIVGAHVRDAFLRDGRVRLVGSAAEADAVLTLSLEKYDREVATARGDDTGLARRFDVTLNASATLHDRRTDRPLFSDRAISAKRDVFTDSGLVQAEHQNLPILARDIADRVVHAVLDTW